MSDCVSLVFPVSLGALQSKAPQICSSPADDPTPELIVKESDLGVEIQIKENEDERTDGYIEDRNKSDDNLEAREIIKDPLSNLPPSLDRNCLDFPFFTDWKTIKHISKGKSKVMFIMRGLSGSGKSSIVQTLKSTYKDSAVCSADDYFLNDDGEYIFDVEKLGNAHGYCQNKARSSCQSSIRVVIIDNTNVKRWEMKFYLDTAKLLGYAVILVEPKTAWKFKPEELALRNKHGVPVELLRKKVETFSHVIPFFYGWFLSHKKSDSLRSLSSKVFAQCLDIFPAFRDELLSELGIRRSGRVSPDTAKEILQGFYTDQGRNPLLHCTACFCGGGKASGGKMYDSRSDVQSSCGRVFRLVLTGLVMTKKTFGVRVTLDDKCLSLFQRREESEWVSRLSNGRDSQKMEAGISSSSLSLQSNNSGKKGIGKNGDKKSVVGSKKLKKRLAKERKKKELEDWFNSKDNCDDDDGDDDIKDDGEEEVKVDSKSKSSLLDWMNERISEKKDENQLDNGDDNNDGDDDNNDNDSCKETEIPNGATVSSLSTRFPGLRNTGFARSAHITLKTTNNVQSVETNFDVLHACDLEHSRNNSPYSSDFVPVPKGQAVHLGDGICCVYFDQPIKMDAVFTGFY